MKEPINKKVVLTVLLGSIVFVIITLSSVAYLIGKDVSNQDTSAAVGDLADTDVSPNASSGDSNVECSYSLPDRRIYVCVPMYVVNGQKYSMFVHYMRYVEDPLLPSWDIKIGKERIRSKKFSINIPFESGRNEFKITVKNTDFEGDIFEKTYKPVPKITSFVMPSIKMPTNVEVGIEGARMSGDLSTTLSSLGVNTENSFMYWETKGFNSAICYVHAYDEGTNKGYMEGDILGRKQGLCQFNLIAWVVTRNSDGNFDKAYRAKKTFSVRITAPTSTATPEPTNVQITPTNPVYITPTLRMTGTPTPTTVISPTPVDYPTISAVSLYPSMGSVTENTQEEVTISFNSLVSNVTALQIRLTVSGATIVPNSYISAGMSIGTCGPEGQKTTTNQVCVDVVKSGGGYFTPSELGSFKILPGTANEVVISTGEGHAYMSNGNTIYSQTQTLAVYQK